MAPSRCTRSSTKATVAQPAAAEDDSKMISKDGEEKYDQETNERDDGKEELLKKKKRTSEGVTKEKKDDANATTASKTETKKRRATSKAKAAPSGNDTDNSDDEEKKGAADKKEEAKPKVKKTKAPPHQVLTERDPIPKLWTKEKADQNVSYTFKIATWNVAGIRALVAKTPDVLSNLVRKHNLDVLCLQETKLQEQHLDDPKQPVKFTEILEADGFEHCYSCSTAKKGYSGTAVFYRRRGGAQETLALSKEGKGKKKQKTLDGFIKKTESQSEKAPPSEPCPVPIEYLIPREISYKIGVDKHDAEGRIITLDYPLFSLSNVYVPNAGQKLERLSYRTEEWDKDLLAYMQRKHKDRGVPVLWLGDLNVAHTHLEVWNDGAKHLPKQAGVTPEERASFQQQLDSRFVDAFRRLHPEVKGHYSYWSTRAGNRSPNKGLRLDYFICHDSFFDDSSKVIVRDSYMDFDQEGSDHCPAILEIEIKP